MTHSLTSPDRSAFRREYLPSPGDFRRVEGLSRLDPSITGTNLSLGTALTSLDLLQLKMADRIAGQGGPSHA
jgi:hypothetical protein